MENSPWNFCNSIKIVPAVEDLSEILDQVESQLKESQIANREIYFITDMQKADFPTDLGD